VNQSLVKGMMGAAVVLLLVGMLSNNVTGFSSANGVNLSNDANNATFPNVQSAGYNIYVAWSEASHGIMFRHSIDGGITFGSVIRVSLKGGTADFPLMSVNGSFVYITWSQSLNSVQQIYFTASSDDGATFSTPIIVDNNQSQASITPTIASYGNDVYIAYNCGTHSCVVSSTNNGLSWTTPLQYASGPEPQIAAYGSSAYAIADTSSRSTTAIAVTHDNGATWTHVSASGGAEPWVSASGSSVLVAWETKGNNSVVNAEVSTNSGISFTKKSISTATPDAWSPMTAISGTNEYIAYRTFPGSANSQEYVAVSNNSGVTWNAPVAIGVAGRDNSWPVNVAVSDNHAFIAWYQKTGTLSTSTWVSVVSESTNNGTTWSAPISLGQSLAESDIATQSIASFGNTAVIAWVNVTSSLNNQVYFATES